MNQVNTFLPQHVVAQIAEEELHFSKAPKAFFAAWKYGVKLAGIQWFGDGTLDNVKYAETLSDLRPNMLLLSDSLSVLSGGQKLFVSALVSFYNAYEGGAMLKHCGFNGLSDLGILDVERRKVIATLLLYYNGW